MADFPVSNVFVAKVETLEEAKQIRFAKQRRAVPYQNYYITNEAGELVNDKGEIY